MRRPLYHLATFGLLLGLLPVALVIADFGATFLRGFMVDRQSRGTQTLRIPSRIYHHDLAPLFSGEDTWGSARVPYFTNELGFRDVSARSVALKEKRPRVLLLGDSFAEGIGVAYPDTFAGRAGSQILNAAVSSYSPIIHYRKARHLMETVGLEFQSVVVLIDLSDGHDAQFYRLGDEDYVEETFPLDGNSWGRLTARDSLSWFLGNHTTILGPWYEAAFCRRHADECQYSLWNERGKWPSDDQLWSEFGEKGLSEGGDYMEALRRLLNARGIPMTIVIYPWPYQIFHGQKKNRFTDYWHRWAKERDVAIVDLFPAFIDAGAPRDVLNRYFIPRDVHWNAEGHAFVANRLKAALTPSRLLE